MKKSRFCPYIVIFGLFFMGFGVCDDSNAQTLHNFASERQDYDGGKYSSANPVKQWLEYYKSDNVPNYQSLMGFVNKHPDFPGMGVLREKVEKAMPSSVPDNEALAWFSNNPPETSFGMNVYSQALARSGQESQAISMVNDWWKTARLSTEDQNKGYGYFRDVLTKTSNMERIRILVHRSQYTNARELAPLLGNDAQNLVAARIALRTRNGDADSLVSRLPLVLKNDEGVLFDRLQYRRKNKYDSGAVDILNMSPSPDSMFSSDDWGRERNIIARRYFEERNYTKAYQISAENNIHEGTGFSANEWMAGWVALEFLKRPSDAFKHFEKLYHGVESPISKSRAAYWTGRASEDLNQPAVAQKWYEAAGRYPTTFYGQLSLEKMGINPPISNSSLQPSALKNSDLAVAAKWLRNNGYKQEAGMFLNKLIEMSKTPEDYAAVANVANDLNMKNFSIKAAQSSEKETGVSQIFYAYPSLEKYMPDSGLEWALIHALIRQESRYDMGAVSGAGARGLMQLMPATAAQVAKRSNLSHNQSWLTSKPAHNIQLGSLYFQKLLEKYNGNYAMSLAAYNAGPARLDSWLNDIGDPREENVDLVNWVEKIPIYETRNYVQRVLEGVYVYRKILKQNLGNHERSTTHLAKD